VAFYGRSGTALTKSLRRLDIDPLAVYGTLTVKCPVEPGLASHTCPPRALLPGGASRRGAGGDWGGRHGA